MFCTYPLDQSYLTIEMMYLFCIYIPGPEKVTFGEVHFPAQQVTLIFICLLGKDPGKLSFN